MPQKILEKAENFLINNVFDALLKLAIAALIIWVGFALTKFIVGRMKKSHLANKSDPGLISFLLSFTSIALKVIVVITAAAFLGIPLTAFVTALGSAGLAIGLALQGSLSNLAGGVMILIFKPFVVGDFIDTHTDSGTVESITVFYTNLITADNRRVTIPNGTISNMSIINHSALNTRRIDFEFTAAYSEDTAKVIAVMKETADKYELIINDPEQPFVSILRQDAGAVVYLLRVWVKNEDYWTVKFEVEQLMKAAFDKNGIEIPFPQLDVHNK